MFPVVRQAYAVTQRVNTNKVHVPKFYVPRITFCGGGRTGLAGIQLASLPKPGVPSHDVKNHVLPQDNLHHTDHKTLEK